MRKVTYFPATADREFSPAIWSKYEGWIDEIKGGDVKLGAVLEDDFMARVGGTGATTAYLGNWYVKQATAGSAVVGSTSDGTIVLTGGGTDDQGIQISCPGFPIVPAAGKIILFECRAKHATALTIDQLFFGMGTATDTAFGSGIRAMTNHVGWFCEETICTATKLSFASSKAGAVEDLINGFTMVPNTYFKLGFVIEGVSKITAYASNLAVATPDIVPATHIPVAAMIPMFAALGENTTAPVVTLDWVRCAYLT